jgi:hypothetical protein
MSCQIIVRHRRLTNLGGKLQVRSTARISRLHKRRGGEKTEEGDRLYRGCQPWSGIVPCRRLPIPSLAAGFRRRALFRGTASHQLRLAFCPLAISMVVRKHRHAFIVPKLRGENDYRYDRAYGIS